MPKSHQIVATALGALATLLAARAAPGVTFTDVTATALPGIESPPGQDGIDPRYAGGAAVGDCDGDGLPDLYFTGAGHDVLFRNRGDGTFEDVTVAADLGRAVGTRGAAFGDIDDDGDLDLYATAVAGARHFLYVNDGHCRFTEDATARGVAVGTKAIGRSVSFGDYDRDGYLDLFVTELQSDAITPGVPGWGLKGKYDSVRPISMIRYLGGKGQSTDPMLPAYAPDGLPLEPGLIEVITAQTTAAGERHASLAGHEGEIAIHAYPGPPATGDPAGVRWIRAVEWVPYQKRTFVTPAFPGYTSGHSTFSRAAAEVMTLFTGDPYFPGGLGSFHAAANEYLTFERGPSVDVDLQWGTYYDAADQAGLSRIAGGIHVPADDFTGRTTGSQVGVDAFAKAMEYFAGP